MKHLSFIIVILSACLHGFSQNNNIGIGTISPHPSAELDVSSTMRGFLPPRMTLTQRNNISSPTAGLMIWCSDCLPKGEIQVYNGTEWTNMIGDTAALNYVLLPSVNIGTQNWQLKNLEIASYRNGDPIPKVTDATQWANLTTGAWCWYNNDSATYAANYGKIYNWYAVEDARGLCPAGWHVPSDSEYQLLESALGMQSSELNQTGARGNVQLVGGKMKAVNSLWLSPNTSATNSSGFTGLPGGYRDFTGTFGFIGGYGFWWTSTDLTLANAYYRLLSYSAAYITRTGNSKQLGLSVRCIRD
jgi:uncharacterized protein (TIGR02145 family)